MSRSLRDALNTAQMFNSLYGLGIEPEDALALRRISMTLHRWYELECGDSNDYSSWCLVRGKKAIGEFVYDEVDGKPFIERHVHRANGARYEPVADKELGARKRLAKIMAKYPGLQAYVQTDPRGCALYILRPGDVPEGADISGYYSRGVAVYK